ncbi:MAG TPA: DUF5700 domain-containing putative Zn-dependent protease, partial [candidate division Zixibacteria bacterium]|nr:DUF5700 domain-containing putative Zn-dependent protease [candidate division Zixibacteria bacterium]
MIFVSGFSTLSITVFAAEDPPTEPRRVDVSAITRALDIFDYVSERAASRSGIIDNAQFAEENHQDSALQRMIDDLLATPAYTLYFRRFSNVTPEDHRRFLELLPASFDPNSPAGISGILFEGCQHRRELRQWLDKSLGTIDLGAAHNLALRWSPAGNHELPPVYFAFDGNAGAFAHDGEVFFDIYGVVLSRLEQSARYAGLTTLPVAEIEGTLAHELQHVYVDTFIAPLYDPTGDWRTDWLNRLLARFVGEGVALHCNPPGGEKKLIYEDPETLQYWIGELNWRFALLTTDSAKESEYRDWLRQSYHAEALQLLRAHYRRHAETDRQAELVALHQSERPSLVYALGWWMVSRISDNGRRP